MTFLEIFKRTFATISSPTSAWEKLSTETGNTQKEDFSFFYSLLGVNVIAAFIGGLFYSNNFPFVAAILKAIIWGIALYGGFWGVYYVLVGILFKRFHVSRDKTESVRLIFYSF